eukprot:4487426-Amphidinium_carterae.1
MVVWGAPSPTRINRQGVPYLASGGVAVVAKNHWALSEIGVEGAAIVQLHQDGRFVAAEVVGPASSQLHYS